MATVLPLMYVSDVTIFKMEYALGDNSPPHACFCPKYMARLRLRLLTKVKLGLSDIQ